MSKVRIETILKYIDDIEYIVSTYGNVVLTFFEIKVKKRVN